MMAAACHGLTAGSLDDSLSVDLVNAPAWQTARAHTAHAHRLDSSDGIIPMLAHVVYAPRGKGPRSGPFEGVQDEMCRWRVVDSSPD